jgi:hypothetical protein
MFSKIATGANLSINKERTLAFYSRKHVRFTPFFESVFHHHLISYWGQLRRFSWAGRQSSSLQAEQQLRSEGAPAAPGAHFSNIGQVS